MTQIPPVRHFIDFVRSLGLDFNVTPQWSCHGFDTRKDERPPFLHRATEGPAKKYLAHSGGRPLLSRSKDQPTFTYT